MKIRVLLLQSFVYAASLYQDNYNQKPTWKSLDEYKSDMMDRTLNFTYNLYEEYSCKKVEYNEYQKELLRIDNTAVKIAFEYFDVDENEVVTKDEMMIFTKKDPEKRNMKEDYIASQEGSQLNTFILILTLVHYWKIEYKV